MNKIIKKVAIVLVSLWCLSWGVEAFAFIVAASINVELARKLRL